MTHTHTSIHCLVIDVSPQLNSALISHESTVSHYNSTSLCSHKIVLLFCLHDLINTYLKCIIATIFGNITTSHFLSTVQNNLVNGHVSNMSNKTHYPGIHQLDSSSQVNSVGSPLSHKRVIFPYVCRSYSAVAQPESVPHLFSSTSGS